MSGELKGAETVEIPEVLRGVSQKEVSELARFAWGITMPEIRGEARPSDEASGFYLPAGQAELTQEERDAHVTRNIRLHGFMSPGCGHVTGKHELSPTGIDGEVTVSMAKTGCLYCDYGRCDRPVSPEEMMTYIDRCIDGDPGYQPGDENKAGPEFKEMGARRSNEGYQGKEYNITPMGSLFDENEVPAKVRRYYFQRLAEEKKLLKSSEKMLIDFETRFEFISEEKLKEMRDILGDDVEVDVGVGTESICEEIRELAGNKKMAKNWKDKVELLHKYGCKVYGHVLVKPPFLTEREAIMDAVGTIKYLEKEGLVDVFIVMTMNRRPNTLTPLLEQEKMYELPSTWSVIEIMRQIGPDIAAKSKFLGFQNNSQENVVHGCEGCNDTVVSKILDYHGYKDEYEAILQAAEETECECKQTWKLRMAQRPKGSLAERIALGMDKALAAQETGFRELQQLVQQGMTFEQIKATLQERKDMQNVEA